jgi:N-acetylneuraminate synthase/sialic acid synthase
MFKKGELNDDVFIIAEVGQNHQGDLDRALEYIKVFASTGVDAIKFQTRNNKILFSESAYNKPYISENSFSDIYGKHRESLELKPEWLPILKDECVRNNVKFMSTPFDEPSLDLLADVGVDILKIASFDLGNLPFIKRISEKNIPVVISVGGGKIDQIKSSVELLLDKVDEVAVLHCVSEYPTEVDRLGLNTIETFIDQFPECSIGLSDHYSGILSGPIGYTKGARVFEKHVTLNRAWKGTDHGFALEPHGCKNFVRDIKQVHKMYKPKPISELGGEAVFQKLGKSITAFRDIKNGKTVSIDDLTGKIFDSQYIPVRESNTIIGNIANRDIDKGEVIDHEMFK